MTAAPGHDRFIPFNGERIYTRSEGEGSPIILIHGWTLDHRMWKHQVPMLSRAHRIITYDRRGFGKSSGVSTLEADIEDLDRVIRAMTPGRVTLCGTSQGARVALHYSARHPERVTALIIQGAPLDGFPPPADAPETIPLERWAELAAAGDMNRVRREWLGHPLMAVAPNARGLAHDLKEMVDAYNGADLLQSGPGSAGIRQPELLDLAKIPVPVLILDGERETPWRRHIARKLADELPDAKLRIIPGAGHLVNMENPDAFNKAILEFLARLPFPIPAAR